MKLLLAIVAAKVECHSIAFGMNRGRFVNGPSAKGVFGYGFGFIHGYISIFGCCYRIVSCSLQTLLTSPCIGTVSFWRLRQH
jgi:hypothetical protein